MSSSLPSRTSADRIRDALEYMRLCAPGLTRGEAADVEWILQGAEGSEELVRGLRAVTHETPLLDVIDDEDLSTDYENLAEENARLREGIRRVLDLRSSHDGHLLVINLQARQMLDGLVGGSR